MNNPTPKPTIEQALKSRLPLPWKQSTCDGPPSWSVICCRPEQLTAELYGLLKKYGVKDDTIRELFYVMPGPWSALKASLGIATGPARPRMAREIWDAEHNEREFLEGKPAPSPPPKTPRRMADVPAGDLKKIAVDPAAVDHSSPTATRPAPSRLMTEREMDAELERVETKLREIEANEISTPSTDQQAVSIKQDSVDIAVEVPHIASPAEVQQFFAPNEDENGLNYQDRHNLGIGTLPEHTQSDFAGWDDFGGEPGGHVFTGLSVGKKFSVSSGCAIHLTAWDYCRILVSPDASKVALKRTAAGVKLQRCKHSGRVMVCRAAVNKITSVHAAPVRYVVESVTPGIVVFTADK